MDSYEWFKNTLDHCGAFLLDLPDEDISYHLFEEFDGDCVSFLNENFLNQLLLSGRISQEIVDLALELSSKFRVFENTDIWNARCVKDNTKWLEILYLADQIKANLASSTICRTPNN